MRYVYDFELWPVNEAIDKRLTTPISPQIYEVFRMLQRRMEITCTEPEFKTLRDDLFKFGFEMRHLAAPRRSN